MTYVYGEEGGGEEGEGLNREKDFEVFARALAFYFGIFTRIPERERERGGGGVEDAGVEGVLTVREPTLTNSNF